MKIDPTSLPSFLPKENAVVLELLDGTIIFRASPALKTRIECLLGKETTEGLADEEKNELDAFEEVDYYLSHVNRLIRNSSLSGEISLGS